MVEEKIIAPVPSDLLEAELTKERRLRSTNKGGNEIYVVTHTQAPNVLKEIGRLREIAFRAAGGGSGKSCDLDEFDAGENEYYQLIVWDPENKVILGGYRFLPGAEWKYDDTGQPILATSHMFHFSDEFVRDYAPLTTELGRSFVTLEYQSSRAMSKGLFALDNLWDGLGALTVVIPKLKFFFGKMTMYPSYDRPARDMILYFLRKHFDDKDELVTPYDPVRLETDPFFLQRMFAEVDFKKDYYILNHNVRERGLNIPPLVNAYMNLSPTMRVFGTAVNHEFGEVEETGILIAQDEILEDKRRRHIESFLREHPNGARELAQFLMRVRQ